jgi:hypothetical protein
MFARTRSLCRWAPQRRALGGHLTHHRVASSSSQIIRLCKRIFVSVGLDLFVVSMRACTRHAACLAALHCTHDPAPSSLGQYPYRVLPNRIDGLIGGVIECVPNAQTRDEIGKVGRTRTPSFGQGAELRAPPGRPRTAASRTTSCRRSVARRALRTKCAVAPHPSTRLTHARPARLVRRRPSVTSCFHLRATPSAPTCCRQRIGTTATS